MNQPYHQTIGEKLRQAREQKGISLQDAARLTHIRVNYLDELESDHPEMFNSAVQARGFLRLYAAFLDLPADELVEQWENPASVKEAPEEVLEKESEEALSEVDLIPENEVVDELGEAIAGELHKEDLEEESFTESENIDQVPPATTPVGQVKDFVSRLGKKVTSLDAVKKITSRIPSAEKEVKVIQPQYLETSEEIFKEIGEALRSRRQKMDLDLTDVEHFTNLKRMYLVALEDGRFNDLPSTVQGRGMLNNYAQFLAMDETAVMDRYAQGLQLQREERMPPPRRQVESPVSVKVNIPEGVRRVLNPDLVVGGVIIVALFGFILWGAAQIIGSPGSEKTEAPSISEVLQMTPTVSPTADMTQTNEGTQVAEETTPVPGVAIVQATATPIATVNAAPLQLYIIANDRAYMRVTVDGQDVFDGRVTPDNAYTYSGNNVITLLTGNAEALEVYFNQEYLGKLGEVGEVVNLRFTPSGMATATPQTTPTATPNPRALDAAGATPSGN